MTYLMAGATPFEPMAERSNGHYAVAPLTAYVVRVVISGFWTPSVMARFTRDAIAAVRALGCAPEEHMILCDLSAAAIQSQPIFAAFLAMLVDGPAPARKVAFVSSNPISRMQARRLMAARGGIGLFEDEGSALHWLTAFA